MFVCVSRACANESECADCRTIDVNISPESNVAKTQRLKRRPLLIVITSHFSQTSLRTTRSGPFNTRSQQSAYRAAKILMNKSIDLHRIRVSLLCRGQTHISTILR
jgi:hypothetical protein